MSTMSDERETLKPGKSPPGDKDSVRPAAPRTSNAQDFVLAMRGVGEEIWADQGGDRFVESLSSNWGSEQQASPNGIETGPKR
jgi:hypothetical protein